MIGEGAFSPEGWDWKVGVIGSPYRGPNVAHDCSGFYEHGVLEIAQPLIGLIETMHLSECCYY